MSSTDKILIDLKLAEFKLHDLKKSLENLKSEPSPVSSINLQWEDIETHFNSLHSSLLQRLRQKNTAIQSLCINMDSKGLRFYLNGHDDKGSSLRQELSGALRLCPDAHKLVLGAVKRCFKMRDDCDELSCVLLLEGLIGFSMEIGIEVKEEAMKVANKWQKKLVDDDNNNSDEVSSGILGFLLFVAAFDLRKEFKKRELFGFLECVCTREQGPVLARLLGLVKKMPELIQNLIDKKLRIEAIRYIYEFGLDNEFSPVPILKDHLDHYKKIAKKIRKKNSDGSEKKAKSKEINALRTVIQCITDHNLESLFSVKSLEKRILKLEKEKGSATDTKEQSKKLRKKCTSQTPSLIHSPIVSHTSDPAVSAATATDPKAQSKNMNLVAAPIAPQGAFSTIHSTNPHHWQSAGFYPDNSAMNFSGGPFIPPHHMNLLAGPYGFAPPGSYSNVPVPYYPGLVRAPGSEFQSQHLSGNKRPRTLELAENSINDMGCEITSIPSEQKSSQPNSSSQNFTTQYLGGFPSMNQQHPGSYYSLPVSYYPSDALTNAPDSEAQRSECTKNAQTSTPSEQELPHPNASFYNNHGLQNYNGHFSLGGFPPMNQHTSSYANAAQHQQFSGVQLPRTLESAKNAQTTPQSNATMYTNQGSQFSLGCFPPRNTQTGSYSGVPASYYPRDALNSKQFKMPARNGVQNQGLNQNHNRRRRT